jgi:hypothetical protein
MDVDNNYRKISKSELETLKIYSKIFPHYNLDLSNQNLNDNNIKDICTNPSFCATISINLQNNTQLTNESIQYIMDSEIIGCYHDLPCISGKYGMSMSNIDIQIHNTSINIQNIKPTFGFNIYYNNYSNNNNNGNNSSFGVKTITLIK